MQKGHSGIKSGMKMSKIKIGWDVQIGDGDPPSVSAKRSQWNKKHNKNEQTKNWWGPKNSGVSLNDT